ncbi:hypothetical protein [Pantoea stewartii]|uniref:hypothetical protein n=1 Tax=Pantoea stewartii TaxID=66269 RepID=UPI0019820D26|nr:hypothetical protein [Pantoea stewartii]
MAMLDNTQVKISNVSVTSNAPFFANKSVSGKYQKRYTGVQFFELKFTANYQLEHMMSVKKFAAEHQYGQPFEFPLSWFSEYKGSAQGTIQLAATANPGTRILKLGKFSGTLEAGSIIRFANHSKLYTVMKDSSANEDLSIFPALRGTVQAGEIVTYRSSKGTFILTNDKIEWPVDSINKIQFTATEVI